MTDTFPTDEQRAVIESDQSALVIAGPGTGKTRTAIEKARASIESLSRFPNSFVLFLSFSNAAVMRLAESARVNLSANERHHLRFLTYHACAADLVRKFGRFVGIPPSVRIIDPLEETIVALERGMESIGSEKGFKELAREGMVSFSLLIPFANQLLSASSKLRAIVQRQYPVIIVDEFQDTSKSQWDFLKLLGDRSQVTAFGDPNQIIYERLHEATATRIDEYKEWKSVQPSRFTARNFRCGSRAILEFGECLLQAKPYSNDKQNDVQLIELDYRSRLRATLALIWKAIQEQVGPHDTIGFLTSSNKLAEDIAVSLRQPPANARVAFPVYARVVSDEASHDAVMLALAALRDFAIDGSEICLKKAAVSFVALNHAWNTRKKVRMRDVKSVMQLLSSAKQGQGGLFTDLLRELAVTKNLGTVVLQFIDALKGVIDFKSAAERITAHGRMELGRITVNDSQLSLFDEMRESRHPRILDGFKAPRARTQVLTYHKAKGREFDFVVLVVDPRHESNKTSLEEMRRLYYVCATRAKKWLGVIHFSNELGRVLGPVLKPTGD